MRSLLNIEDLFYSLTENDGSVGEYLGITDPSKGEWAFAIYVGKGRILSLYDQRKGLNQSAFEEILQIRIIIKQSLINHKWSTQNVRDLESLMNYEYHIVYYKMNLIDICLGKSIKPNELIKVLKHNLEQIHTLEEGDVVKFERGFYSHHAILTDRAYMKVTHKWGEPEIPAGCVVTLKSLIGSATDKACVAEDFLIEVADYRKLEKGNHLYDKAHKAKPREEILAEARKRLGEIGYSVTKNNCQTFCSLVRNGVPRSPEVEEVKTGIIYSGVAIIVAASAYMFSRAVSKKEEKKEIKVLS